MKPEDFGASLLDQAHRLRSHALAVTSSGTALDERGAVWLIRLDQRARLMLEFDALTSHLRHGGDRRGQSLLGLPIRFTVDDDPSAPEIQLVMEPALRLPSRRW